MPLRTWERVSERFEELGGLDMKGAGEGHDIQESNVALAALDTADIVAMEVG